METPTTGTNLYRSIAFIASCLSLTLYSHYVQSDQPTWSHELELRARYETVEVDGNHGDALTARLRLAIERQVNNWQVFAEADYVAAALRDNHSDGVRLTSEPTIADPRGFDLNQLLVRYQQGETRYSLGRQQLGFGDHRFVGDVDFRQQAQTYDGVRIQHNFLSGLALDYAYVAQVNRIFGQRADRSLSRSDIRHTALAGIRPTGQLGEHEVDAHLLHFQKQAHDYVQVFGELHAVHNSDHAPFSNRTAVIGLNLNYKPAATKWQSSLIYARQQKHETLVDDWLTFSRIEVGATQGSYQFSLRHERFGSKNGESFVTPLATLHKFQGWADRFLNTPPQGLEDNSLLAKWNGRDSPVTVEVRFHDFRTVAGGQKLGTEFNLDMIYEPSPHHTLSLRFADFDADDRTTQEDVTKLFLTYHYKL